MKWTRGQFKLYKIENFASGLSTTNIEGHKSQKYTDSNKKIKKTFAKLKSNYF